MGASERLRLRTRRERRDKNVKLDLRFTIKNKEEETRGEEKSLETGGAAFRVGLVCKSETRAL